MDGYGFCKFVFRLQFFVVVSSLWVPFSSFSATVVVTIGQTAVNRGRQAPSWVHLPSCLLPARSSARELSQRFRGRMVTFEQRDEEGSWTESGLANVGDALVLRCLANRDRHNKTVNVRQLSLNLLKDVDDEAFRLLECWLGS